MTAFSTSPCRRTVCNALAALVLALFLSGTGLSGALAQTSQPVQITADRFVVRESENRSEFIGNVVVEQPGLKIWAARVLVHYGEGGTSDIRSFEALGNVRIQNDQQTATGERAVYDPETRILRLTGNVRVINESGTVNAGELVVDLSSSITEFSSGNGTGRVTGLFTPEN